MIEDLLQNTVFDTKILMDSDCYFYFGKNSLKLGVTNDNLTLNNVYNIVTASNDNSAIIFPIETNDLIACKSIHLGVSLDRFVIVPSQYFDPQVCIEYLQQVFEVDRTIKPISKHIKSMDAFLVYQLEPLISNCLLSFSKNQAVISEIELFVNYISKQTEHPDFYINFDDRSFVIFLVKDSKICHIQRFNFEEASDAVYFILGVLKQFNIDPVTAKAIVSGLIMPLSGLFNQLFQFIGEIEWFDGANTNIKFQADAKISRHTIAELLCLSI